MRCAGAGWRAEEPADEPAAAAVDDAGHHQNRMTATAGPPQDASFVVGSPRRYRRWRLGGRLVEVRTPITDIPPNEVRLAWASSGRTPLIAEFVELAQAATRR